MVLTSLVLRRMRTTEMSGDLFFISKGSSKIDAIKWKPF